MRDRVLPPLDLDSTCTRTVQRMILYSSVRKYFRTLKVLSYFRTKVLSYLLYFRTFKYLFSYESTFVRCTCTTLYTYEYLFSKVKILLLYFVLSKVHVRKYNVLSYFRKYNYNVVQRTKVLSYFRTKVRCTTTIMYESTKVLSKVQINVQRTKVLSKVQLQLQRCTTYESTFVRK